MLGFIMRNCSKLNDHCIHKCLYTSLIIIYRNNLKYTQNISFIYQIESVKNKILRFICFKYNILSPSYFGYDNILNLLKIMPLLERKNVYFVNFLIKI